MMDCHGMRLDLGVRLRDVLMPLGLRFASAHEQLFEGRDVPLEVEISGFAVALSGQHIFDDFLAYQHLHHYNELGQLGRSPQLEL